MARVAFINPANGDTYEWHRGYETEDDAGKTRQISGTANTGLTGRVRQQGDDGAYVRTLHGRIVHAAQHQAFWAWYALCASQTVYFRDHDDAVYEVQITGLNMHQQRRLPTTAPDPTMSRNFYEYTMTLEIYRFVSGRMAAAGVTP